MKITRVIDGSSAQLILRGEMDIFVRDPFLEEIDRLVADGVRRVHLDLLRVRYMSSSGVTALLRARRKLLDLGGELTITRASGDARRTLEILGIDALWAAPPADPPAPGCGSRSASGAWQADP